MQMPRKPLFFAEADWLPGPVAWYVGLISVLLFGGLWGCRPSRGPEVIVYTALDEMFSARILDDFSTETGVMAVPKFDTEATKSVGLANTIVAEAARPRCDVFWNNEVLNTIRLSRRGLLEAFVPAAAADYPEMDRAADGTWHGFAARARILLVNTRLVPAARRPEGINDLADPRWKGRVGIAKPLFGTTATHAACLFSVLGEQPAKRFFRRLKQNAIAIESGNRQVAVRVATGQLAFGLTDSDDALVMIDQGYPVAIVYPDRQPGELGTLFIPNTLAIVKGCPHPRAARRLVEYLLQGKVEARLATGPSGQIPLNRKVDIKPRVETPRTVKAMQVDFAAAARQWDTAAKFIRDEFAIESPREDKKRR